ncbi:sensor histidine kinase [Catenulispora pinisilvae]|uniref:sensor histidine kinase n=1 Tax=Catenulispora pinisilvae TaxID=2705253 RepID=UPI00189233B2|nr:histidine kinase [Catenulispora pinisilvae]
MTPEIQGKWPDSDADVPALARMRSYTTWTMVFVVAAYVFLVAGGSHSPWILAATLGVGALVCWQCRYWEHGAPRALTAVAVGASYALFCVVVGTHINPIGGVAFALSIGLVVTAPPFSQWPWTLLAVALAVLPALVLGADCGYVAGVVVMMTASVALFRGNRFGFGLFLEVNQARQATAELAVMRERYRFAADLHDIQGQALHVSRLKLRLADKLLDGDPALARIQVREAEQLIADAIAETRRLAYGQRTLTFAGELANSESLIRAAGIVLTLDGTVPPGHRLDELFGLVVREATTNLLRHAHAEHVAIIVGADSVQIVNDGVTEGTRALSGLARLGERFAAAGGTLTTSRDGQTFTTSARDTADLPASSQARA